MADNTQLPAPAGPLGDVVRTLAKTANAGAKTQVVALDVGGGDAAAETLLVPGQQAMAASVPVVLASDQSPVVVVSEALASIVDSTTTAGYTYICEAQPGQVATAATWRVSRLNQSTGQTQWAGGSASFTQIASNRASLTYS